MQPHSPDKALRHRDPEDLVADILAAAVERLIRTGFAQPFTDSRDSETSFEFDKLNLLLG